MTVATELGITPFMLWRIERGEAARRPTGRTERAIEALMTRYLSRATRAGRLPAPATPPPEPIPPPSLPTTSTTLEPVDLAAIRQELQDLRAELARQHRTIEQICNTLVGLFKAEVIPQRRTPARRKSRRPRESSGELG